MDVMTAAEIREALQKIAKARQFTSFIREASKAGRPIAHETARRIKDGWVPSPDMRRRFTEALHAFNGSEYKPGK